MYLKSIDVKNFRNYNHLSIDLNKGINIIYGKNAQGKTNLLESIYFLALTKSHRSFIDDNLIKNGEENAIIKGKMMCNRIPTNLEIRLNKNKNIFIDKKKITKVSDYISRMNVIIFYPEDLDLVKGSPNIRRKFLNLELCQLYSNYYIVLNEFNKLLKMRNDYLKKINLNHTYDQNYLDILNNYFVDKGIYLFQMRKKFVEKLNNFAPIIYQNITGNDNFKIDYVTNVNLNQEKNNIKEEFLKKLSDNFEREVKLKSTIIGPHRDDLEFYLNDQNIKNYGSQGQQRVTVLSIKLAEIDIFKKYRETNPILLLDDIFSELDTKKKNNLLRYIKKSVQTIITTTDLNQINKKIIEKSKLIQIENGQVKKIEEVR